MNKSILNNKKGFTLVEILAVILIVGVISLISISGVSRYVAGSKKEKVNQNKKNVAMAAELYVQNKRELLPSLIGGASLIPLRDLRSSNYLKEDVTNDKGEDCMEKSFVRVYKLSEQDYSYTTYLYCGKEEPPEEPDIPKPVVLDFEFTGGNKSLTTERFNDVKDAKFTFTIKGADDDDTVGIYSYNYSIFVRSSDAADATYEEVFNSGNLKGGLEPSIGVTSQKLSSYMSLTGYTNVRVDVHAINEQGGEVDFSTASGGYEDKEKPECGSITGQARDDNDWINKVTFGAGGNVPDGQTRAYPGRVSVNCTDGLGSGCKRDRFTRSWPNNSAGVDLADYKLGARWSYVTLEDNASTANSIKCYVRANVDVQAPKIEVEAHRASDNALLKTFVVEDGAAINAVMPEGTIAAGDYEYVQGTGSEKWMNLENFGTTGVYFNVSVSDNLYLYSYEWKVNNPYIAGGTPDQNVASSASTGNVAGEGTTIAATGNFDNSFVTDNPTNDNELKTAEHGALSGTISNLKLVREGKRYASLKVCDKAGNCSTVHIYANIDVTPPLVPRTSYVTVTTNSLYVPGNASNYTDHEHWSKEFVRPYVDGQRDDQQTQNASIKVTLSGWDHFVYSYRKQSGRNESNAIIWANAVMRNIRQPLTGTTVYGFDITDQGTHRVAFRSCDKAGNCSEYSVEDYPKIDTIKPGCHTETKYINDSGVDISSTISGDVRDSKTGSSNGSGWLKLGENVELSHSCYDNDAAFASGCNDGDFHNQQTYLFNSDINTTRAGANGYNAIYGPNDLTAGGHVIDYAGNLSSECPKITVKVDHIKPNCATDISWPEGNPLRPTQAGKPETGWLGLVNGGKDGPDTNVDTKKTAKIAKICSDPKSNSSSLMANVSSSCDNDGTYDPVGYNKQFKIYNYEMEVYNRAGAIDVDDGGLIIDIAGNTNDCPHDRTVKIDYTKPICTTKLDYGTGTGEGNFSVVADPRSSFGWLGWRNDGNTTKEMARVTQVCADTGSIQSACYGAMLKKVYALNLNTDVAGAVGLNDNGYIQDTAGNKTNCSTSGNWKTVKIDYVRPVCYSTSTVSGGYFANGVAYDWNQAVPDEGNYETGYWVGRGATVTIRSTCTPAEPPNPVATSTISGCNTDKSRNYTAEIKTTAATTAGDGQDFWVYDKADNRSDNPCAPKKVQIDHSAPTCETQSRYGANPNDNSAMYDGDTTGYQGWLNGRDYKVLVRSQCVGDTLANGKTGSGCGDVNIYHNIYSVGEGQIMNTTRGAAASGNGYVIYDKVGNSKTCEKKRIKLDYQYPKCTLNANYDSSSGGESGTYNGSWTNADSVTISRSCNDGSGSGCDAASLAYKGVVYSVRNEQWMDISNAGAISAGNSGTVQDNVGLITTCPANKRVRLDKTKPTCTYTTSNISGHPGKWTNKNAVIQGYCHDTGSGCKTSDSELRMEFGSDYNGQFAMGHPIYDKAGNHGYCSIPGGGDYFDVKVQKSKPSCWTEKTLTHVEQGVTDAVHCNTASSPNPPAPLDKCGRTTLINSSGGSFTDYNTRIKATRTYTVRDVAGNSSSCTTNVTALHQNRTRSCTTCNACSAAGCQAYNTCANSACGSYSCNCTTKHGCYSTSQRGKTCSKLQSWTNSCNAGMYWCEWKSCDTCYYSCATSGCGCKTYYRNCAKCNGCYSGLGTWSTWFQGETAAGWYGKTEYDLRTIYY